MNKKKKVLIFAPKSSVAVDASLLSAEGFSMAVVAFSFTGMFLNLEYKSFFSVQIERKETQIGESVHGAKTKAQHIKVHARCRHA